MSEKKSFFDSSMCKSRKNCEKCRVNKDYREGISKVFDVPEIDFKCPVGKIEEEYKDIEFPSLFGAAKNLFKTGKDVANHKRKGGRILASDDVQKERLDICNACNYFVNNSCKKCRCNLRAKTSLAGASCPLNKWLSVK